MEDTEGFEPSKDRKALVSLARRWFQPLTHVSSRVSKCPIDKHAVGQADKPYSEQYAGNQHPSSKTVR